MIELTTGSENFKCCTVAAVAAVAGGSTALVVAAAKATTTNTLYTLLLCSKPCFAGFICRGNCARFPARTCVAWTRTRTVRVARKQPLFATASALEMSMSRIRRLHATAAAFTISYVHFVVVAHSRHTHTYVRQWTCICLRASVCNICCLISADCWCCLPFVLICLPRSFVWSVAPHWRSSPTAGYCWPASNNKQQQAQLSKSRRRT